MDCYRCGTYCPNDANFCPNCGRSFKRQPRTNNQEFQLPKYPHAESLTALQVAEEHRFWFALGMGAMIGIGTGLVACLITKGDLFFIFLFGCLGWLAGALNLRHLREKDYHQIPHAVDSHGNHRCIHCGNKGIYRKGEYKTANTYSYCSKCKAFLFKE